MSEINKRRLVFSIIQFLNREMASDEMSEDAKESLEVASQCLQTAFSFSAEDVHLEVSKPLEQIFNDATQNEPVIEERLPCPSLGLIYTGGFNQRYRWAVRFQPVETASGSDFLTWKIFYSNRSAQRLTLTKPKKILKTKLLQKIEIFLSGN